MTLFSHRGIPPCRGVSPYLVQRQCHLLRLCFQSIDHSVLFQRQSGSGKMPYLTGIADTSVLAFSLKQCSEVWKHNLRKWHFRLFLCVTLFSHRGIPPCRGVSPYLVQRQCHLLRLCFQSIDHSVLFQRQSGSGKMPYLTGIADTSALACLLKQCSEVWKHNLRKWHCRSYAFGATIPLTVQGRSDIHRPLPLCPRQG